MESITNNPLIDRFSLSTAARAARLALIFGFSYGGVQDLVGLARGRPIAYVEALRRRVGGAAPSAASNSTTFG